MIVKNSHERLSVDFGNPPVWISLQPLPVQGQHNIVNIIGSTVCEIINNVLHL